MSGTIAPVGNGSGAWPRKDPAPDGLCLPGRGRPENPAKRTRKENLGPSPLCRKDPLYQNLPRSA